MSRDSTDGTIHLGCIRLLAIRFQVSASDLHANTLMSAKALEVFIAKLLGQIGGSKNQHPNKGW